MKNNSLCVKLHPVCKITHSVWNYTLCVKLHTVCIDYTQYVICVKLHTVCELTHSVQNFTAVPCAFNMKKFPSLEKFYTHAVTDVTTNISYALLTSEIVCYFYFKL